MTSSPLRRSRGPLAAPAMAAMLAAICTCATSAEPPLAASRDVAAVEWAAPQPVPASAVEPAGAQATAPVPEQQPWSPLDMPASTPPLRNRHVDIGTSTAALLAAQRASKGTHARPFDGEQAGRSYQRYLKSFETAIPERFDGGLDAKR
jgi:hypothetical protein